MNWTLLPGTDFASHMTAWRRLNELNGNSVLLDPKFLQSCLSAFGDGQERLAILGHAADPYAMGIFAPMGKGSWQTWQPANAPLGFWLKRQDCDLVAALRSLMSKLSGLPLLLGISQQDPALVPRPEECSVLSTLDYIVTARIEMRGMDYSEYWRQRGKNLRHNIKRQNNRLARDKIQTRLDVVTDKAQLAEAVRDYALLESGGWKGGIGTAVTPDGAQARFYRTMLEAFAENGKRSYIASITTTVSSRRISA